MEVNDIRRILTSFADDPAQVDVRQGRIVVQLQDELVDVRLETNADSGELWVVENGARMQPRRWITNRIARLPQLADRILTQIANVDAFVTPCGSLRTDIALSDSEDELQVANVVDGLLRKLNSPIPAQTSVLYLTSDAGEGKTTLINQLARRQAEAFKSKKTHWLLVPVPLGGKAFLRFDDVVVATFVNRLRFNYYYYDAFLELVRMGAIVPAFDGFEEMFVEGHSGEAVSALGNFIEGLDSQGSVVVAARKAFFEYSSFRTQAKLFDSIGSRSASFSRLRIDRWGKDQFLEYAKLRGSVQGEAIYRLVSERLGNSSHPLLTRAVLVRRLFDVATSLQDTEQLLAQLGTKPQDYFFNFVDAIVKREANEKWLDKSGDAKEPLLSPEEHHELLASLAREMWQSSTFSLKLDVIDVLVDLFLEPKKKNSSFVRQVKERIKNHSLLVLDPSRANTLAFDHDDFRRFYLGESLGRAMAGSSQIDLQSIVAVDQIPSETCDQAVQFLRRSTLQLQPVIDQITDIAKTVPALSFARENCGGLIVRLLGGAERRSTTVEIDGMTFPAGSLAGHAIVDVEFRNCYFQPSRIATDAVKDVTFVACEFERIELSKGSSLNGIAFTDCRFLGLQSEEGDLQLFGPMEISTQLVRYGAKVQSGADKLVPNAASAEADYEIKQIDRFLRIFLRTTQVNEDVLLARLGKFSHSFIDNQIPELLRAGVVEEIAYVGRGQQRRFKLAVPMRALQDALASCEGRYAKFLQAIGNASQRT